MSEKRKRVTDDVSEDHASKRKKVRGGFKVGPDNLPDGAYKRKLLKRKANLIQKAQIKKDYAKIKRDQHLDERDTELPQPATVEVVEDEYEPSTHPHPDRQELIERGPEPREQEEEPNLSTGRKRKPKSTPFKREYDRAQQRKAEADERRKAREEAERQRQLKLEDRERFRKAMAKARRGGPNGQRKLGRESKVLLEKVKRMVGEA